MREINNTNNLRPIQQPEIRIEKNNIPENIPVETQPSLKDFANPKAEALGRSQVITGNDNVKNDVVFLTKNPKAVKSAEQFFNHAYAQLLKNDEPNAYEKAAAMATIYAREFAQ